MQLRMVRNVNGKSFHWACNGPECPYESPEIEYTADNYDAMPPLVCPKCNRSGDLQAAMMSEGIPASPQSVPSGVFTGRVGHWGHPDKE